MAAKKTELYAQKATVETRKLEKEAATGDEAMTEEGTGRPSKLRRDGAPDEQKKTGTDSQAMVEAASSLEEAAKGRQHAETRFRAEEEKAKAAATKLEEARINAEVATKVVQETKAAKEPQLPPGCTRVKTVEDGNCLYRAVGAQLPKYKSEHDKLRKKVAEEMKATPDIYRLGHDGIDPEDPKEKCNWGQE